MERQLTTKEKRTAVIDTLAFLAIIVFAIGGPYLPWAKWMSCFF